MAARKPEPGLCKEGRFVGNPVEDSRRLFLPAQFVMATSQVDRRPIQSLEPGVGIDKRLEVHQRGIETIAMKSEIGEAIECLGSETAFQVSLRHARNDEALPLRRPVRDGTLREGRRHAARNPSPAPFTSTDSRRVSAGANFASSKFATALWNRTRESELAFPVELEAAAM